VVSKAAPLRISWDTCSPRSSCETWPRPTITPSISGFSSSDSHASAESSLGNQGQSALFAVATSPPHTISCPPCAATPASKRLSLSAPNRASFMAESVKKGDKPPNVVERFLRNNPGARLRLLERKTPLRFWRGVVQCFVCDIRRPRRTYLKCVSPSLFPPSLCVAEPND